MGEVELGAVDKRLQQRDGLLRIAGHAQTLGLDDRTEGHQIRVVALASERSLARPRCRRGFRDVGTQREVFGQHHRELSRVAFALRGRQTRPLLQVVLQMSAQPFRRLRDRVDHQRRDPAFVGRHGIAH
jgi:hypothetical protein